MEKESISEMLKLLFDSNRNLSDLKIEQDKEDSVVYKLQKKLSELQEDLELTKKECAEALK